MTTPKPREWWIEDVDFDLGYHTTMVAEFPHKDTLANSIHVIEYSAFSKTCEQLLGSHAELVELRSAYEAIAKDRDWFKDLCEDRREQVNQVCKERDALKAQLAGLAKDHADDWKRIQDAERARDEALASKTYGDVRRHCGTSVLRDRSPNRSRGGVMRDEQKWRDCVVADFKAQREQINRLQLGMACVYFMLAAQMFIIVVLMARTHS